MLFYALSAPRNRYLREQLGSERRKGKLGLDHKPLGITRSSSLSHCAQFHVISLRRVSLARSSPVITKVAAEVTGVQIFRVLDRTPVRRLCTSALNLCTYVLGDHS